jgi:hypothetical protein
MPRCLRTAGRGYLRAVLPRATLLVACAAANAMAGCGGSGDPAVAHVAGREIKKSTLEDTITHFRTEAKSEGHEFPEPGTDEYRTVQRQLLRLLVQRAELEAAAAREGVHATDAEAEKRLAASGGADPGEGPDAFAVATAHAQLVQERLFGKVTRGVSASTADARAYFGAHRSAYGTASFSSVGDSVRSQLLAVRKDEAMHRWLDAMHRRLDPTISYAKGYAP